MSLIRLVVIHLLLRKLSHFCIFHRIWLELDLSDYETAIRNVQISQKGSLSSSTFINIPLRKNLEFKIQKIVGSKVKGYVRKYSWKFFHNVPLRATIAIFSNCNIKKKKKNHRKQDDPLLRANQNYVFTFYLFRTSARALVFLAERHGKREKEREREGEGGRKNRKHNHEYCWQYCSKACHQAEEASESSRQPLWKSCFLATGAKLSAYAAIWEP